MVERRCGTGRPVRVRVLLGHRDTARVAARFEDCDGVVPLIADRVTAVDPIQRLEVPALVAGVDERHRRLILEPDPRNTRE